jgi:hypothetical protein
MKILAILLYLGVLTVWAYKDAKGKNLIGNYIASWIIKYMLAFASILWVWYQSNVPYGWQTVGVFILFSVLGWIVFDAAYKIFRGLPWNYLGTTAWSDRWFGKFWIQILVKAVLLFVGLYITLKL